MTYIEERNRLKEIVIESFESLIDMIRKFLKKKGEETNGINIDSLLNKLCLYIDSFQVSKINGLRVFVKHVKRGFTPTKNDTEGFVKQVEELIEIFEPSKLEKIKRIVYIIQKITDNIIKYSYEDWANDYSKDMVEIARRIQRVIEYMANLGDLDGIFTYYSNLVKDINRSKIGRLLEEKNKNEFKKEFSKIKEIYFMN